GEIIAPDLYFGVVLEAGMPCVRPPGNFGVAASLSEDVREIRRMHRLGEIGEEMQSEAEAMPGLRDQRCGRGVAQFQGARRRVNAQVEPAPPLGDRVGRPSHVVQAAFRVVEMVVPGEDSPARIFMIQYQVAAPGILVIRVVQPLVGLLLEPGKIPKPPEPPDVFALQTTHTRHSPTQDLLMGDVVPEGAGSFALFRNSPGAAAAGRSFGQAGKLERYGGEALRRADGRRIRREPCLVARGRREIAYAVGELESGASALGLDR